MQTRPQREWPAMQTRLRKLATIALASYELESDAQRHTNEALLRAVELGASRRELAEFLGLTPGAIRYRIGKASHERESANVGVRERTAS